MTTKPTLPDCPVKSDWEDKRMAIIALLAGIDETENESDIGWWETSEGAEFGANILKQIKEL